MKQKIVFILGALLFVNMGYSNVQYCPVSKKDGGYVHNGQLMPKCTENDSPEIWSGSWEDLQVVAKRVEEEFSFETTKHKGRDIASLKPASKQEMEKHISNGNYQEWSAYIFDSYHEPSDTVDDVLMEVLGSYYMSKDVSTGTKEEKRVSAMMKFTNEINKALKFLKNKVVKYTNSDGGEVVYDKETGKIILNSRLGTKNFGKSYEWIGVKIQEYLKTQDWFKYTPQGMSLKVEAAIIREVGKYIPGDHFLLDVVPHEKDNQYKYAGILFESDSDGRFYIVDGQTGKRMTKKQVEVFPTTFSDMWKDKGRVCVKNDAVDIVPSEDDVQLMQNASSEDGNDAGKNETLPVIDTTKLEGLLQNRISFLSRLVAVGKKITKEESRKENSLSDSVMTELASLAETISLANVPDDKKIKMLDDIANRCMPYVEKISGLLREAEARGIATIKTGNLSAKLQENVRKIRNSTGKISND